MKIIYGENHEENHEENFYGEILWKKFYEENHEMCKSYFFSK